MQIPNCSLYISQFLAEFCKKKYPNIKTASLHPGGVRTNIFAYVNRNIISKVFYDYVCPFVMKNTEWGAQTHLYLSFLPFEKMNSGEYYAECAKASTSTKAKNRNIRNVAMKWSFNAIKKYLNENEFIQFTKYIN